MFLLTFTSVCVFAVGVFVYIKNRKRPVNRVFFALSIFCSGWVASLLIDRFLFFQNVLSVIPSRFAFAFSALIAPTLAHFILLFPEEIKKSRSAIFSLYIPGLLFFFLSFTNLIVRDAVMGEMAIESIYGPLRTVFAIFFLAYICFVIIIFTHKYIKATSKLIRLQMKYLAMGLAISFFGGIFCNLLLPIFTGTEKLVYIGPSLALLFVPFFSYAIITYRLMDIAVVVTRGGVLAGTYAFIIGVPALVASVARPWLAGIMGRQWWVPPLGLFAGLALVGPFVALFLIRRIEAKDRERELRAEEHLERTAQGMIEIDSVDKLVKLIPRYLTKFYYANLDVVITHASIFLHDKDRREYVLKSTAGIRRISLDRALPEEENPFYIWFKKIVPFITENRFVKRRELDVLQREDIDFWLKEERLLRLGDYIKPSLMELKKLMAELRAVLCVPSFYQEGLLGFLILGEKEKGLFSVRELGLFFRLARYAALAIRSAQLSQDLQKAYASVAQSDRLSSMGQLAASFAHEINNPVAIIIAGIELSLRAMRDDLVKAQTLEEKEKVIKYAEDKLEKIKDEAFRISRIIGRIMGYVRASTDDFGSLSLNDLVEATLGLVEHPIRQRQINVVKEIPEDLPRIRGIAGELQEVFLNLFNNALEAMEGKTGGTIGVSASVVASNPETVEVKVSDTGCGIPKENLRKIFDFLFTTKLKGTGVGLSVVYDTIKKHDGSIGVESEAGKRTTFTIRLPVWK